MKLGNKTRNLCSRRNLSYHENRRLMILNSIYANVINGIELLSWSKAVKSYECLSFYYSIVAQRKLTDLTEIG